jgi:hypothetical protein
MHLFSSAGLTSSILLLHPTHSGPPTSHGGFEPTGRSTRSRAAKSEPTGTSALPGGAWPVKSCCEMEVRIGWGYHPGYQTGTVWLPTLFICRLNVLKPTATPHLQRTSDLARGRQAPCSSTPKRAADLRPSREASGPRAAAREVVPRRVSRRGRRRSQGVRGTRSRAARWRSQSDGSLATGFASNPQQRGAAITT